MLELSSWLSCGPDFGNRQSGLILFPKADDLAINFHYSACLVMPLRAIGTELTPRTIRAIVEFATTMKPIGLHVLDEDSAGKDVAVCALLLHLLDGLPVEEACRKAQSGTSALVHPEMIETINRLIGVRLSFGSRS